MHFYPKCECTFTSNGLILKLSFLSVPLSSGKKLKIKKVEREMGDRFFLEKLIEKCLNDLLNKKWFVNLKLVVFDLYLTFKTWSSSRLRFYFHLLFHCGFHLNQAPHLLSWNSQILYLKCHHRKKDRLYWAIYLFYWKFCQKKMCGSL